MTKELKKQFSDQSEIPQSTELQNKIDSFNQTDNVAQRVFILLSEALDARHTHGMVKALIKTLAQEHPEFAMPLPIVQKALGVAAKMFDQDLAKLLICKYNADIHSPTEFEPELEETENLMTLCETMAHALERELLHRNGVFVSVPLENFSQYKNMFLFLLDTYYTVHPAYVPPVEAIQKHSFVLSFYIYKDLYHHWPRPQKIELFRCLLLAKQVRALDNKEEAVLKQLIDEGAVFSTCEKDKFFKNFLSAFIKTITEQGSQYRVCKFESLLKIESSVEVFFNKQEHRAANYVILSQNENKSFSYSIYCFDELITRQITCSEITEDLRSPAAMRAFVRKRDNITLAKKIYGKIIVDIAQLHIGKRALQYEAMIAHRVGIVQQAIVAAMPVQTTEHSSDIPSNPLLANIWRAPHQMSDSLTAQYYLEHAEPLRFKYYQMHLRHRAGLAPLAIARPAPYLPSQVTSGVSGGFNNIAMLIAGYVGPDGSEGFDNFGEVCVENEKRCIMASV